MGDDEMQGDINTLKTHFEFIKKRLDALEAWKKDTQANLDSINDERSSTSPAVKAVQKNLDDVESQLDKRIKTLEDKTKNLKK